MGILGSVLGGVVDFFGGQNDKHAAKNNITTYSTVGNQSTQQYEAARQAARDLNAPYYHTGTNALAGAANMLQPGFQYSPSDPSYAWRLQQGLGAVEQSAASRGLLHSGGALKALKNYAQGAASQQYQQDFNNRNTLAGYGQDAARTLTNAEYSSANGINNALFKMADGLSGAYQQKADAMNTQNGALGGLAKGLGSFFGVPGF